MFSGGAGAVIPKVQTLAVHASNSDTGGARRAILGDDALAGATPRRAALDALACKASFGAVLVDAAAAEDQSRPALGTDAESPGSTDDAARCVDRFAFRDEACGQGELRFEDIDAGGVVEHRIGDVASGTKLLLPCEDANPIEDDLACRIQIGDDGDVLCTVGKFARAADRANEDEHRPELAAANHPATIHFFVGARHVPSWVTAKYRGMPLHLRVSQQPQREPEVSSEFIRVFQGLLCPRAIH